ncbi:Probable plastid-lipid-associated protein 10, chloroplastic, variant 2 [Dionaea muscipula]
MELALQPLSNALVGRKFSHVKKSDFFHPKTTRRLSTRKLHVCLASTTTYTAPAIDCELENKKQDLLRAIQDTQRGLNTTADQRLAIEEALVSVEGFDAGAQVDLVQLDGTWRLQYTTASDVLVLFDSAARLPFLQVGQIFQKFECRGPSNGGIVRNVIKWSIDNILEEEEGATLLVTAKFSVVSRRNIQLEFEEVGLQDIKISEELQALIAPAILPRSFISLQILQFLRAFKARVSIGDPNHRRYVMETTTVIWHGFPFCLESCYKLCISLTDGQANNRRIILPFLLG